MSGPLRTPPPRSSQLPPSPAGSARLRRVRKPPVRYGWEDVPGLVDSSGSEESDSDDEQTVTTPLLPPPDPVTPPPTTFSSPPSQVPSPPSRYSATPVRSPDTQSPVSSPHLVLSQSQEMGQQVTSQPGAWESGTSPPTPPPLPVSPPSHQPNDSSRQLRNLPPNSQGNNNPVLSQDIPVLLDDLPPYHVVHRQHIPTITHIPKGARNAWTRLLTSVGFRVANNPNNISNHILLSMVARVILPAGKLPPHPGQTTQATQIQERIRRWNAVLCSQTECPTPLPHPVTPSPLPSMISAETT